MLLFADLSGGARWERLGRGLAAEIGADLARSKGVVVIPAETAEAAAGEPRAVARALGMRFVMDGTLQAQGNALRVTARLTDGKKGAVVWSDRWERPAEDLFAVQDEIVDRIGGALDGTWTGALARAVSEAEEGRPTESLEAYELYLRGVEAKHEFTQEGFAEAVPLFRRALELDPDFVQTMVALSITLMFRVDFVPEAEAKAVIDESYALAERAVELAPDDPNALLRLACLRVQDGQRDEAWSFAERAVALAPTNPDVLAVAAGCYFFADHGWAPLDWAERAVALNPGHPRWYNIWLAQAALFQGETDLALRAGREAPEGSADITIAAADALSGNVEEARRLFDRLREQTGFSNLSDWWWIGDLRADPACAPWVRAAEIAGFPVTAAEADVLAARQGPPRP